MILFVPIRSLDQFHTLDNYTSIGVKLYQCNFPSHPWSWLAGRPGGCLKKQQFGDWEFRIIMESDTVSYLKVSRGYKVLSMILDLNVHFPQAVQKMDCLFFV